MDVEARFPCGHRIVDWDDSYGHCVACSLIAAAHEHDNCPLAPAPAPIEKIASEIAESIATLDGYRDETENEIARVLRRHFTDEKKDASA